MEVRDRPAIDVDDMERFFRFAEEVFQFRRKQIGGTLARIAAMGSGEAAARLAALGIDAARRPQTLTLKEWEAVFGAFNSRFGR
jgi:16S rRNA A1518/A1519 N6-dimethyltransferase RsmA/KsgA/DIM1 with predicted DNA glycosylase/AP lyase activity